MPDEEAVIIRTGFEQWIHFSNLLAFAVELGQLPNNLPADLQTDVAAFLGFPPVQHHLLTAPFPLCLQFTSKLAKEHSYDTLRDNDITVLSHVYADASHAYLSAIESPRISALLSTLRGGPNSTQSPLAPLVEQARRTPAIQLADSSLLRGLVELLDVSHAMHEASLVESPEMTQDAQRAISGLAAPLLHNVAGEIGTVREVLTQLGDRGIATNERLEALITSLDIMGGMMVAYA